MVAQITFQFLIGIKRNFELKDKSSQPLPIPFQFLIGIKRNFEVFSFSVLWQ
jgi:hypothetical protein